MLIFLSLLFSSLLGVCHSVYWEYSSWKSCCQWFQSIWLEWLWWIEFNIASSTV